MKLSCLALAACLAQAMTAHAGAAELAGANEMVRGTIEGYVVPAYAGFATKTRALDKAVSALCKEPSQASLSAARDAFAETVDAWSRVELVRFGPIVEDNRLERVLYWPDRRSTGLKQVQAILAREDPTAADPAALPAKSVAVQGLGALEFVLFGTGSADLATAAGYRCAYAGSITQNLETVAGTASAAWSQGEGAAGLWAAPRADNPLYRDGSEALGELMDVLVHGLELVRDVRIDGFLGEDASQDRPKQALFWRSEETISSLRANLASIGAMLDAAAIAEHLPEDRRWIVESARFELGNAERVLATIDGRPIADLLADPEERAKLAYLRLVTSSLSDVLGRQLTAEFGLTAGFSSLDGD